MTYPKYYKVINDQIVTSNCEYITVEKHNNGITTLSTIINPTEEQILANGWEPFTGQGLSDEELLQKVKDDKLREIDLYDKSSEVNIFTINNQPMWLDHNVRQQLKSSIESYQLTGYTSVTKIFNEQEYTFTVEQWLQMLALLEVYAAEALNVTENHKIAVKNLTNVQDVQEYDITAGYPSKLNF